MKKLLFISSYFLILLIFNTNTLMSQNIIYNFDNNSDLKEWVIVNDDVMGGTSSSNLIIESDGNGVFEGRISTAYNGGFSSLRFSCNKTYIKQNTHFKIKIEESSKIALTVKKSLFQGKEYSITADYKGETWNVFSPMPFKKEEVIYVSFEEDDLIFFPPHCHNYF